MLSSFYTALVCLTCGAAVSAATCSTDHSTADPTECAETVTPGNALLQQRSMVSQSRQEEDEEDDKINEALTPADASDVVVGAPKLRSWRADGVDEPSRSTVQTLQESVGSILQTRRSFTARPADAEEKEGFLAMHNLYRCMHGVPEVIWSDAVAENAHEYIKGMTTMVHAASYQIPPPAGPAGENLAMGSGHLAAADAVTMWYNEVDDCQGGPEGFTDGCAYGVGSKATGHFTALIWKGVQEIGCAFSDSTSPTLIICRYRAGDSLSMDTPNMNKPSNYPSQVFPRSFGEEECEGGPDGTAEEPEPQQPTGPAPATAPVLSAKGASTCEAGSASIPSEADCQAAATSLGVTWGGSKNKGFMVHGCSKNVNSEKVFWNTHNGAASHGKSELVCQGSGPAPATAPAPVLSAKGASTCEAGSASIPSEADCQAAATSLGVKWGGSKNKEWMVHGCSKNVKIQKVFWNTHNGAASHGKSELVCQGSGGGVEPAEPDEDPVAATPAPTNAVTTAPAAGECLYSDPNWQCSGSNCVPKDKYTQYSAAGGAWCLTDSSSYCQKQDSSWCQGSCACPGNCPHACGRCPPTTAATPASAPSMMEAGDGYCGQYFELAKQGSPLFCYQAATRTTLGKANCVSTGLVVNYGHGSRDRRCLCSCQSSCAIHHTEGDLVPGTSCLLGGTDLGANGFVSYTMQAPTPAPTPLPPGHTYTPTAAPTVASVAPPTAATMEFYFGSSLPSSAASGAVLDVGTGYGTSSTSGGQSYGWDCDGDSSGIDYAGGIRGTDRGGGLGLNHFDRFNTCMDGSTYKPVNWQLEVPNGQYDVQVVFAEGYDVEWGPGCEVEGVNAGCGDSYCEVSKTVTITDGKFTVTGYGHDSGLCKSLSKVAIQAPTPAPTPLPPGHTYTPTAAPTVATTPTPTTAADTGACKVSDPTWTCTGSMCKTHDTYSRYSAAGGPWCLTSASSYCQKQDASWCGGQCNCPGSCAHACGRCP